MSLSDAEIHKFLSSVEPFKALSVEDLGQVARSARAKSFSKGETVYNEGETADSVWILYKGRIQVFKYTSQAKALAIESLGPGEMFGTLCRLGGDGRSYPCTAVAAEPTVALRILDRTFLQYYMKSPGFIRGLCSLCAERLKDVQDLRCMGQEAVPVRIASTLARLYQVHGAVIPFTKKEISELVGAALETTFRVLSDLQEKGILDSSRGKIHVKKPQELKSLARKS